MTDVAMPVPKDIVPTTVHVDATTVVSGLFRAPADANLCLVLAHGAGAGMTHPFMAAVADGLCSRAVATLRFNFPFKETGSWRVDRPALAQATVRAAVETARRLSPGLPLFAGGKSFGARMTSQAQAQSPLVDVRGLVFLGFPMHKPGVPSDERSDHLSAVSVPMLFLQGTKDALAAVDLLQPLVKRLGNHATLTLVDQANHSFQVPVKSGRTNAQVMAATLDLLVEWMSLVVEPRRAPGKSSLAGISLT